MNDDAIYSNGNVNITQTIAKIDNISYPINGVTAVFVKQKDPNIFGYIVGGIMVAIGILGMSGSTIVGLIFLVIGGLIIAASTSRPYYLMLRTSSGDTQALESKDIHFVSSVRAAIEKAVTSRG